MEITESQAWIRGFFSGVTELTTEEKTRRVALVRSVAERARDNAEARSTVERWLEQVEPDMPQEAATFRAFYLDGETKPTARQVGRSLCMDKTSVFRHNRRVLKAMLPAVFGLDGLFQSAEG